MSPEDQSDDESDRRPERRSDKPYIEHRPSRRKPRRHPSDLPSYTDAPSSVASDQVKFDSHNTVGLRDWNKYGPREVRRRMEREASWAQPPPHMYPQQPPNGTSFWSPGTSGPHFYGTRGWPTDMSHPTQPPPPPHMGGPPLRPYHPLSPGQVHQPGFASYVPGPGFQTPMQPPPSFPRSTRAPDAVTATVPSAADTHSRPYSPSASNAEQPAASEATCDESKPWEPEMLPPIDRDLLRAQTFAATIRSHNHNTDKEYYLK